MKFLKNNKGVTGIDLAISILIIIVSVTLITVMYSRYIEKSREVERNTMATNIAMQVIEEIKITDFEEVNNWFWEDTDGDDILDKSHDEILSSDGTIKPYNQENALDIDVFSTGYTAKILKVDEIENVSMKLKVEVEYKIGDKSQKTELSITKSKEVFSANVPDLNSEEVKNSTKDINVDGTTEKYTRYFLKYSNTKKGYIEAKSTDDDWYSISGKKFAVIAYAKESPIPFNTNGVIDFTQCIEIYVWVPRFELDNNDQNYKFCYEDTNYPIIYEEIQNIVNDTAYDATTGTVYDTTYSMSGYAKGENEIEIAEDLAPFFSSGTGKWVRVNQDLNPIDNNGAEIESEDNILNILKTKEFTWAE